MNAWKEINIGSIGDVITGNTPLTSDREFYGGSYQFIKPTDMDIDRRFVTSWEENYSEKAFKKYKNSYIPKGATGVVTIGTVGEKIFQADRPCFTNQSVNVVIPNQVHFDDDFIFYLLKYNLPKVSSANPGTASGRHHVSKSNFCSIKVLVPKEKSTQIKIGKILSSYDLLIENYIKRIKLLEEFAERTYDEWFVKFIVNNKPLSIDNKTGVPIGFERAKFRKYFTINNGYAFKSTDYEKKGVKILRTKDYSQTKWIEIVQPIYISEELAKSYSKYYIKSFDLMLIMVGASIGNYGIVLPSDKGVLQNQNQWAIRAKDENFDLYKILMMEQVIKKLLTKKTGSARDFFRAEFLNEMDVIVPDYNNVNEFNKIVHPIFSLIDNLRCQISLLKEARNTLLTKLMTGILKVES